MLWNLNGILTGYHAYVPHLDKTARNVEGKGRYFTHVSEGNFALFGVETLSYRDDIVCVAEGLFDVNKIHNAGIPALAIFSSNISVKLVSQLKLLNRKIIAVIDNDGKSKLGKYADVTLSTPISKDLGDADYYETLYIINQILKV